MKTASEVKQALEESVKNLFSLIGLVISFEVKEDEDGYLIKSEQMPKEVLAKVHEIIG